MIADALEALIRFTQKKLLEEVGSADDKTIANIFTEILAKGARLDDPEGLLVLLQDPEISVSQALEQRFREKRGMRQ